MHRFQKQTQQKLSNNWTVPFARMDSDEAGLHVVEGDERERPRAVHARHGHGVVRHVRPVQGVVDPIDGQTHWSSTGGPLRRRLLGDRLLVRVLRHGHPAVDRKSALDCYVIKKQWYA